MAKPLLLDLFCGAGGASRGYADAGFDILGIDIEPQPRYPYDFQQTDAIFALKQFDFSSFDVIHASPPCQRYSLNSFQHSAGSVPSKHEHLVDIVRMLLHDTGLPYVIENVEGAPLVDALLLCGSMFGFTQLRRHRLFESSIEIPKMRCNHKIQKNCVTVTGQTGGSSKRNPNRKFADVHIWRELMGIDWMFQSELVEAIPPAYTHYIGSHLISRLTRDSVTRDSVTRHGMETEDASIHTALSRSVRTSSVQFT